MHSGQMALDHLWAPGEATFVSLRSAHSIVRPSSVEPQERGKNLLLHSPLFPYSSEWKEKKHNGSMGKWQDGVWARRGTQRRRRDLGTGQGGVGGSETGAKGSREQGQQAGLRLEGRQMEWGNSCCGPYISVCEEM